MPIEEGIETNFAVQTSQQSSLILLELLKSHNQVFDDSMLLRETKHSITVYSKTTTEVSVWSRARQLTPDTFVALKPEMKHLVNNRGIFAESQSPWASPIVMVKKPSAFDCAPTLNEILKITRYSLPNINDFSFTAHRCSWFSSIDIKDEYYHIPVNPTGSHKLTITNPWKLQIFLPTHGSSTSSGYFQKLMNKVFSGLPRLFCILTTLSSCL